MGLYENSVPCVPKKTLDYHNFPYSMATIGGIPWHTHPLQTPKSLSWLIAHGFLLEKLGYRDIFPTKHHVWEIFWILFGEHW